MSIPQVIEFLEQFQGRLEAVLPSLVEQYGLDLAQIAQARINERGEKADGSSLKDYTEAYLKFKKAPQNTARGKTLGLGSSRYTGVVDYTLTNQMWGSVGVKSSTTQNGVISVTVGSTTTDGTNKMLSLLKRDGQSPLAVSPSEKIELAEAFKTNLKQALA